MTLNLPSSSISLRLELLTGSNFETEIEDFIHLSPLRVWQTDSQGACYFVGTIPSILPSLPPSRKGKRNAKGREKEPKEGRGQDKLLPLLPRNSDIDNVDKQSNTRWLCR